MKELKPFSLEKCTDTKLVLKISWGLWLLKVTLWSLEAEKPNFDLCPDFISYSGIYLIFKPASHIKWFFFIFFNILYWKISKLQKNRKFRWIFTYPVTINGFTNCYIHYVLLVLFLLLLFFPPHPSLIPPPPPPYAGGWVLEIYKTQPLPFPLHYLVGW